MNLKNVLARSIAALLLAFFAITAQAATLLPNGEQVFVDSNGAPLAGGSVTFYIPSTTTLKSTWRDSGQTTLNTNPVVLDSAGRAIIYGSGAYRQIVKDANGNTIWDQITADTSASTTSWAGTSGGTANAQTVSASNFTNADGQSIGFIAGFTNTGAFTVNPNGTGPIAVLKDTVSGPVALTGGEVFTGNQVTILYDATGGYFHLVSFPSVTAFGGPLVTLASSGTTDLGSVTSHTIQITGTSAITSFGSSASTLYPLYQITFASSLTLTHNGTSLILPGAINRTTQTGDAAVALYLGSGNWRVLWYMPASVTLINVAPNVQVFTSGSSATYTTPANALYLRVRMCAGGAGGGGATANNGTSGNTTSFSGWTVLGGTGTGTGGSAGQGGPGGTGGVNGTGSLITRVAGGGGGGGSAGGGFVGGAGGSTVYGGAAPGVSNGLSGVNAATNSCAGGSGGGTGAGQGGGGGGSGEYVEFIITAPTASYTYTVGTGGTGGAAGGFAGGNGAAGRIEVIAYFQ